MKPRHSSCETSYMTPFTPHRSDYALVSPIVPVPFICPSCCVIKHSATDPLCPVASSRSWRIRQLTEIWPTKSLMYHTRHCEQSYLGIALPSSATRFPNTCCAHESESQITSIWAIKVRVSGDHWVVWFLNLTEDRLGGRRPLSCVVPEPDWGQVRRAETTELCGSWTWLRTG